MADISDFDDDARSGYDMNEYTQGNYDGMIGSQPPSPPKVILEKRDRMNDDDDDVGTCTDIGDCMDDRAEEQFGSDDQEQGYFDAQHGSQDISSWMKKQKYERNKKGKGKGKGRA